MIRCLLLALVLSAAVAADAPGGGPVRVVIVGITHDHVFWLLGRPRDLGDIEIVGVYEPNEALALQRMRDAGLPPELYGDDLQELLERTKPDAAVLFGSIRAHHEHALVCLDAGAHVMVEKPLATTLPQAQEMAAAARTAGRHLLTNYETTWYASVREARERVASGDLGAVRRMVFRMGHKGPIEIGCRDVFLDWLCDPAENGGGAITDFGCYGVNQATWLMRGERPRSVTCVTKRLKPDLYPRVDDDATLTLEYDDAVAVVQASWAWPHNVKETRVYTERADLLTQGSDGLRVHRQDAEPETLARLAPLPAVEADPFAHLAAVVRGETEPNALSSVENNLIVVEVLDAARRSAQTGRRVVFADR